MTPTMLSEEIRKRGRREKEIPKRNEWCSQRSKWVSIADLKNKSKGLNRDK